MAYTHDVRSMLCGAELKKDCCMRTELGLFVRLLSDSGFIKCDNKELARRIALLFKKIYGARPQIAVRRETDGKSDKKYFIVNIPEQCGGPVGTDFFENAGDCCLRALLRCVFIAAGTVSSPEKSSAYVELYFSDEQLATTVGDVLSHFGIRYGSSVRRKRRVVYIKNFEGVCDFLTLTGAQRAMLEFQVNKTSREVTNNVNRTMNCDMANIDRSSGNAQKEVEAIELLASLGRLEGLPPTLYELAVLRRRNRIASLSELGALLNPPLSKSGVSHRMKKITELAASLAKNK